MATNVTEKDKTLQEIIDWCADLANELRGATDGDFYANVNANLIKADTLTLVIRHCRHLLGRNAPPADAEIEAGAKAFYEALNPDSYPQWDSDCALRAKYYDAMRLAVKAMQGKATEDDV